MLSSHSSDPECNDWDPTGKTPDEIVSVCADYERGQRSEMAKRQRRGVEGTRCFICAHSAMTEAELAAIRAMAAPHPLERKWSKGYAQRIVAGGIDSSSSDDEAQ